MKRILVTRPEPGASTTAAKLVERGYSAAVLPLTRIVPLSVREEHFSGPFTSVAATSANAVRHAPPRLLATLRHLPAFAVGERTKEAFRKHGFARIRSSRQDAGKLAETIVAHSSRHMRVAYLCGRERTKVFEAEIDKRGMESAAIETYDAEIVRYEADSLRKRLAGEPFDAVLLYSARAAEACGRLLESGAVELALFEKTRFLCLSPRIATVLPGRWKERAVHCALPEENALFRLLANS